MCEEVGGKIRGKMRDDMVEKEMRGRGKRLSIVYFVWLIWLGLSSTHAMPREPACSPEASTEGYGHPPSSSAYIRTRRPAPRSFTQLFVRSLDSATPPSGRPSFYFVSCLGVRPARGASRPRPVPNKRTRPKALIIRNTHKLLTHLLHKLRHPPLEEINHLLLRAELPLP